jgi:hypothetical protein
MQSILQAFFDKADDKLCVLVVLNPAAASIMYIVFNDLLAALDPESIRDLGARSNIPEAVVFSFIMFLTIFVRLTPCTQHTP